MEKLWERSWRLGGYVGGRGGGVRATYIIGGLISARLGPTSQRNAGDASNKQPCTAETRRTVFNGWSTSQRAHVLSAGDVRAGEGDWRLKLASPIQMAALAPRKGHRVGK